MNNMSNVCDVLGIEDLRRRILDHLRGIDRPLALWSLFKGGVLEEVDIRQLVKIYYEGSHLSWYRDELCLYDTVTLRTIASDLGFNSLSKLTKKEVHDILVPFEDMLRVLPTEIAKEVDEYMVKLRNASVVFRLTGVQLEVPEEPVDNVCIENVLDALVQDIDRRCTKSTVKSVFRLPDSIVDCMPCEYCDNPHYKCAPAMRLYSLTDVVSTCISHYGGSWEDVLQAQEAKILANQEREERKRRRDDDALILESWLSLHGYDDVFAQESEFFNALERTMPSRTGYQAQKKTVAMTRVFQQSGNLAPDSEPIQTEKQRSNNRLRRWSGRMQNVATEWSALGYDTEQFEGEMSAPVSQRKKHVITWGYVLTNLVTLEHALHCRKVMQEYNLRSEDAAHRLIQLENKLPLKNVLQNDTWKTAYPSLLRHVNQGEWINKEKLQRCLAHGRTEAEDDAIAKEQARLRMEIEKKQKEERMIKAREHKKAILQAIQSGSNIDSYFSWTINQHGVKIYKCPKCEYSSGLTKMSAHVEKKGCFSV
jgi:hypothetical protein